MITPWNFPMAISSWKLLPAVVCGNACVIKPAQDTPLSTFNLVQALTDAGVPKGVINIVTGFGAEVGTPLAEHSAVRAISLTGSSAVAESWVPRRPRLSSAVRSNWRQESDDRAQRRQPRPRHRRRTLGVRSVRPESAAPRRAASSCRKASTPSLSIDFVGRAKKIKVGNGLDETVETGPAINENELKENPTWNISRSEKVKAPKSRHRRRPARPGRVPARLGPRTHCIHRRRSQNAHRAGRNLRAGGLRSSPVTISRNAIEIANNIEYGLSSLALHRRCRTKAFAAVRDLEAGITYINAPTIGAEVHLPFGGTKATGNGHREGGIGAIDFYTEWKAVYVDYSDKLQKAQIDRVE